MALYGATVASCLRLRAVNTAAREYFTDIALPRVGHVGRYLYGTPLPDALAAGLSGASLDESALLSSALTLRVLCSAFERAMRRVRLPTLGHLGRAMHTGAVARRVRARCRAATTLQAAWRASRVSLAPPLRARDALDVGRRGGRARALYLARAIRPPATPS